jgi:DNA-binding CsgD family transcriptional regulator
MSSLVVLVSFALFLGFATLLMSYLLHQRYQDALTQYVFYRQLLLFFFGIYGLLTYFVLYLLLGQLQVGPRITSIVSSVLPFLGTPILLTAWYLLIRIGYAFNGREMSGKATISYFLGVMLVFLITGNVWLLGSGALSAQSSVVLWVLLLLAGIECVAVFWAAVLFFSKASHLDVYQKKVRHQFFIAYASGYVLSVLVVVGIVDQMNLLGLAVVIFFLRDLVPVLLLFFYYQKHGIVQPSNSNLRGAVEHFFQQEGISPREREIIRCICQGKTNKEISKELFITEQTVKDHTHRIYSKTGLRNRIQLANKIQSLEGY